MTEIERTIEFCSELVPHLKQHLRGASSSVISNIENALGRPLFPAHRSYLEHMGEANPGFGLMLVDLSPSALLDACKKTAGILPEGIELLGVGLDDPWTDLVLRSSADREPTVWAVNSCIGGSFAKLNLSSARPVAGSLAELFCMNLLDDCRGSSGARCVRYAGQRTYDPSALERAVESAKRQHLVEAWPSNRFTKVFVREGMRVVARQLPNQVLTMAAYSDEAALLNVTLAALEVDLALELTPADPFTQGDASSRELSHAFENLVSESLSKARMSIERPPAYVYHVDRAFEHMLRSQIPEKHRRPKPASKAVAALRRRVKDSSSNMWGQLAKFAVALEEEDVVGAVQIASSVTWRAQALDLLEDSVSLATR